MANKKVKLLDFQIFVVRDDEVIPFESLSVDEQEALKKRKNQGAIREVARMRGLDVTFRDIPKGERNASDMA